MNSDATRTADLTIHATAELTAAQWTTGEYADLIAAALTAIGVNVNVSGANLREPFPEIEGQTA